MRDIVFIAGNGLPIDLRANNPLIMNSSQPLSVNVIPQHHFDGERMADLDFNIYYPHLMEVLRNFGSTELDANHFDVIKSIISADIDDNRFLTTHVREADTRYRLLTGKLSPWSESGRRKNVAISQLRLYLIYVYSFFDQGISQEQIDGWRWAEWLRVNLSQISQIISFNYDIIIDRAVSMLSDTSYILSQHDARTRLNPLMLSKPHGSINHTIDNMIETGQVYWNLPAPDSVYNINQGPVSVIPRNYLYRSRQFSDMVLPTEVPGARREMRHIDYGYRRLTRIGRNANICVIAGLSYSAPDRPEINEIIHLVPRARFLVCDPKPSPELIEQLDRFGRKYTLLYNDRPNV